MNANIKGIKKRKKKEKRTYEDIISNVGRDYMNYNGAPTTTSYRSVASYELLQVVVLYAKGMILFVLELYSFASIKGTRRSTCTRYLFTTIKGA